MKAFAILILLFSVMSLTGCEEPEPATYPISGELAHQMIPSIR